MLVKNSIPTELIKDGCSLAPVATYTGGLAGKEVTLTPIVKMLTDSDKDMASL